MVKKALGAAVVLSLALPPVACVKPVHKLSVDESFMKQDAGRRAWRKVAVLPFTGDPALRRVVGEWLAFQVRVHGLFEIRDPSLAEIELGKKGSLAGGSGFSAEEARRAGELLGVDGVVSGSIDSRPTGGGGSGTAGASVIDVATGKVVAETRRAYFAPTRDHQAGVSAAVDGIAGDLLPVLYAAAGKAWTPPPKQGAQKPAPEGRDPEPR